MISIVLALAAAASGAPRPVTAPERAIIEAEVKPELETPGTLKFLPIPAGATIVCGKVNGMLFKVEVERNAKGRIIAASQASVRTPDKLAVVKLAMNQICMGAGYDIITM